jgi:hypothetical protein|tara:strand:- start:513 stop:671 length:159 start_codon:yes stop_codon:yes gene_type:complete
MDKKRTPKKEKIKEYFHDKWAEEEALLNLGLAESRRAKKERLDKRKKNGQTN